MLSVTLQKNKRSYQVYNEWRKQLFVSNTPKDAEVILYLLPWMLSVNHEAVPGYVEELKRPFKLSHIDSSREILDREYHYKKKFGIQEERFSVRYLFGGADIQGIYTIGSAGTISQTSRSDCDIWVCIDIRQFDEISLQYLNQKLNMIKGWLDEHIKIPVYFFLTDVHDIQNCKFGNIDFESSGSTQKNILKEEFYRTTILICGKIPFWWVAWDNDAPVDYEKELKAVQKNDYGDLDFIDFGNLTDVHPSEYYGAALWQLNKSLTHPLKSIIKMLLLKMFLESPDQELLCNKFRRYVLYPPVNAMPPDPSLFTMKVMLDYYSIHARKDYFEFIKKCFYLRYEMKLLSKRQTQKDEMAGMIFKTHHIEREDIYALNEFASWDIDRHIDFGGLIFEYVADIYRDVVRIEKEMKSDIAPEDLMIIGRKLASSMSVKNFKVPILNISSESIKLPVMTFVFRNNIWQVYASSNSASPVIANEDMIFCLTYLAWNGIFDPSQTRMQPNPTSATVQEIMNLGRMILDVFGTYNISQVHFSKFLAEEIINKILVTVSFGGMSSGNDIENISIIYQNNWEELFVRQFSSIERMKAFFARAGKISPRAETRYYVQRNNRYYEKIIDRTKHIIEQMIIQR